MTGQPARVSDHMTRAALAATDQACSPAPRAGETRDHFLGGALILAQPERGYRAGLDAVLLASAAPIGDGEVATVADVGAGVGTVGLCIARRSGATSLVLIEQDATLCEIATRNAALNGLSDRVRIVRFEIGSKVTRSVGAPTSPDLTAPPVASIDHAVANPPYFPAGQHRMPTSAAKAAARMMPIGGIEAWARFCARIVRPGGSLTLIYPAAALRQILSALEGRFGAIEIKPVLPYSDREAVRILFRARKGSRAPLSIVPPLVVHQRDGSFTPDVAQICQGPASLSW